MSSEKVAAAMTRAEKTEMAQSLRDAGLSIREIAERMDSKRSTVSNWLSDPDGSRLRARKAAYGDPCVDCGARTTYGAEQARVPDPRCTRCARAHYKVWTREAIICAIQEWAAIYGEPPAVGDWNAWLSRNELHDEERACRYEHEKNRWPCHSTLYREFGSWNSALVAAGFEARPANGGGGNIMRQRRIRVAA